MCAVFTVFAVSAEFTVLSCVCCVCCVCRVYRVCCACVATFAVLVLPCLLCLPFTLLSYFIMRLPCLLCLPRLQRFQRSPCFTFAVFALYILNFFCMAIIIMAALYIILDRRHSNSTIYRQVYIPYGALL